MKLICNGKEYEVNKGKSILEILKDEIEKSENEIIACNFNNEIKSLNYIPEESGKVELLDYTTTEGKRVYVRGISYIMAMAINELYPEAFLTVNYQLDNSMYCTLDNMYLTDEALENIKIRMNKLVYENLPIKKVKMTQEEAEEFYEREKTLRGILQIDNETNEEISLYYCKDYYNYFYGVMPISTGYMKIYDVIRYSNGFLLRYPSKINPNRLDNFKENK